MFLPKPGIHGTFLPFLPKLRVKMPFLKVMRHAPLPSWIKHYLKGDNFYLFIFGKLMKNYYRVLSRRAKGHGALLSKRAF